MKSEIIHLMILDKFNVPFIEFVEQNLNAKNHKYIFLQKPKYEYGMTKDYDIVWIDKKLKNFKLLQYLYQAKKIIIHGLWSDRLLQILYLQPWLLQKCYWVMWGGDFYFPKQQSWLKKQVIKKMGHLITYIKGDYELAKKWYGAKGQYHKCLMYPSNLYKEYNVKQKKHNHINIQLGNSADPTNNHLDILKKLEKYKDKDIKIFTPLSYSDLEYAKEVIKKGEEIFGDKFIPLTEFMPFDKYLKFLGEIDIAIFAHKRQQAMGNTITLLGLGKKVYMRRDVTPWKLFEDIGVKIFDVNNITLDLIDEKIKIDNQQKIKSYFSHKSYIKQLKSIFDGEGKL